MRLVTKHKNIKFVASGKANVKRTRATNRPQSAVGKKNPWLWILSGALAGILISSSIFVKFNTATATATKPTVVSPAATKTAKVKSLAQPEKKATPVFEFYKVLPKMNEATAATKTPAVTPPPPKPVANPIATAPATLPGQYFVQVKTVQQLTAADALKATLTLSGFDAQIVAISQNNATWYRITLGPFNSQQQALAQQKLLATQNIHGSLIKQNP